MIKHTLIIFTKDIASRELIQCVNYTKRHTILVSLGWCLVLRGFAKGKRKGKSVFKENISSL